MMVSMQELVMTLWLLFLSLRSFVAFQWIQPQWILSGHFRKAQ